MSDLTAGEREAVDRLGLTFVEVDWASADPAESMAALLENWSKRYEKVLFHLDIDLVNFFDLPISENITRVGGLPFAAITAGLTVAWAFRRPEASLWPRSTPITIPMGLRFAP